MQMLERRHVDGSVSGTKSLQWLSIFLSSNYSVILQIPNIISTYTLCSHRMFICSEFVWIKEYVFADSPSFLSQSLAAITIGMLADRGFNNFVKPMAHYWPEFAQHGKYQITVEQLQEHEIRRMIAKLIAFFVIIYSWKCILGICNGFFSSKYNVLTYINI